MAEQASTDISLNTMSALVGTGSGSNVDLRDACNSSSINKFSWYRTRPISLDGNNLCTLPTAPTTDRKLGDFRRYNHISLTPSIYYDPGLQKNYGPGTGTFSFSISALPERMNLYELSTTKPMKIRTDYYASSANRAAQTSLVDHHTMTTDILSTEDGKGGKDQPPGHTNDELYSQTSSNILWTDTAFDPTNFSASGGDFYVYTDTYLTDTSGNEVIRLGTAVSNSYKDILFHELENPIIDESGPNFALSGYTGAFAVCTTNSSSGVPTDRTYSNGDTAYGTGGNPLYWYIVGLKGSPVHGYRIGDIDVTVTLELSGHTDTTIHDGTLTTAGASSNQSDTGSLAASQTFQYDDVWELNVVLNDITGITEYDLGEWPL